MGGKNIFENIWDIIEVITKFLAVKFSRKSSKTRKVSPPLTDNQTFQRNNKTP